MCGVLWSVSRRLVLSMALVIMLGSHMRSTATAIHALSRSSRIGFEDEIDLATTAQ